MTFEAWVTLAVVAGTVALLMRDVVAPALAILGATVTLLVLGVITPEEAFQGFSNPAPITVGALYVLARAVEVTGALQPITARLLRGSRGRRGQLLRVVGPTMAASSVLNNTPIVAMVAPAVRDWAERRGETASRFLIPLSYAAILGGLITAIGTSTNLIVSGLLFDAGRPPLGLFELARVGLPAAVVGGAAIVALAPRVLPERRPTRESYAADVREFTLEMQVEGGGPLDGVTLEDGGLRALKGVYCVELVRAGATIAPVAPTEVLRGGDELTFAGKVDEVVDLQRLRGLRSTAARHLERLPRSGDRQFFEAVVGASSPLVGRTAKEVGFRERYQAAVLAVHRSGKRVDAKVGDVRLGLGDTLLLLADPGFRDRWRESGDFLLIAALGGAAPVARRQAVLTGLVVAVVVLVAGTGLVPILEASLVAAVVVVAGGALSVREARGAINLDVLVVIAAAFGLGAAVASSGLADVIADGIVGLFAPLGAVGALAGVLLTTMLLTELITNNAAAVLTFPVATAAAATAGADARPFAIAVAVGASLSFITPIGYQTNLMVYALGGYRFTDFARLGVPLSIIAFVVAVVAIPLGWPL